VVKEIPGSALALPGMRSFAKAGVNRLIEKSPGIRLTRG
jgi:hypothetical protein